MESWRKEGGHEMTAESMQFNRNSCLWRTWTGNTKDRSPQFATEIPLVTPQDQLRFHHEHPAVTVTRTLNYHATTMNLLIQSLSA